MQNTFLAPLLSATSSTEVIWIMARSSLLFGRVVRLRRGVAALGLDRALQGAEQPPALGLRHRTRLDDLDDVADLGGVVLVVHVVLHAPGQELVEPAVADAADHRDGRRLVHVARRDGADDDAARAALIGLRGGSGRIGHDFACGVLEDFARWAWVF